MGNQNERKVAVNKEIVLMRQAVRKTRLGIIWKLTKESQRLKSRQHGDEKVIKKCKRKGGNLIKELRVLKKLKDDEISKYAITNDKSITEVLSDPKAKLKTRILTRMAFHKILKTRIEEFKKKFPDYLEFMGPGRRERSKIEFIEKKKAAKNTDGDENNKDEKSDNDEDSMSVEGDDNSNDDVGNDDDDVDNDVDNDDDDEEEVEDEEKNQSEINDSESEKDIDDEDDEDNDEEDDEDENEEDDEDENEDDEDDDADENSNKNKEKDIQKVEKNNKVLIEHKETLITEKIDEKESKKANNLLQKKVKIQEKNKTKKTTNSPDKNIKRKSEIFINEERVVKRFRLDDEKDVIAIDTVDDKDPIDLSDEETNVMLTDDPFFHPGGIVNKKESNNFNRNDSKHGGLNRRNRRALMNNNNIKDTKNNDYNRQDKSSSNNNYDRKYNNKFTKQNDDKFKSNDYKNKFNDKINKPTIEKDLHPSWLAKKKQQVIITQGFQGNKIIFD